MPPGDDPQDSATEWRVTDRRRFTSEGDMREQESGAEPAGATPEPVPPAAPPPPPAATAPPEPAPSLRDETPDTDDDGGPQSSAAGAVYDLGIEAVAYVFYQSALIALGAAPPGGPPPRVDLAEARQAITFLQVLEEKTRGNLTVAEDATMRELLSDAKMAYVQVARGLAGGGP